MRGGFNVCVCVEAGGSHQAQWFPGPHTTGAPAGETHDHVPNHVRVEARGIPPTSHLRQDVLHALHLVRHGRLARGVHVVQQVLDFLVLLGAGVGGCDKGEGV